jgi:hypothetical protein
VIRSGQRKNNQIRILTSNAQLSSFTTTVIILNPTVGLGCNFMWTLLTCFSTLVYNFRSIRDQKDIAILVNRV